jgi:ATP-dependent RNA helicase DDX58
VTNFKARFSGRIKILVVTSIAEEGIDISACNLIIKYNNVGSERTMIQRRGRARSLDSKSVLICLDGEVEQREIQNVQREQLLHQCLMNLQAKSGSQLEAEILKAKKEHDEKERQIKEETERRCKLFSTKCYDLLCHECNEFVCRSEFMRSMVTESHFCCVDPRIWQYINIARTDSPSVSINFNIFISIMFRVTSILSNVDELCARVSLIFAFPI